MLAEQHDPIEAAPVDEGTKLLIRIVSDHMREQSRVNEAGHANTAKAIDRQTDKALTFAKQAGLVLIALVVFVVGGFMVYVGVSPREAAGGVHAVIGSALAEQGPAVAGSAAQPE